MNEFVNACKMAVAELRNIAPYDTGNLSRNGIRITFVSQNECRIYVDDDWWRGIAPYMKYTNEDWAQFKPPLQGKQNPNQGWWDNAIPVIASVIARKLKGAVKENDND